MADLSDSESGWIDMRGQPFFELSPRDTTPPECLRCAFRNEVAHNPYFTRAVPLVAVATQSGEGAEYYCGECTETKVSQALTQLEAVKNHLHNTLEPELSEKYNLHVAFREAYTASGFNFQELVKCTLDPYARPVCPKRSSAPTNHPHLPTRLQLRDTEQDSDLDQVDAATAAAISAPALFRVVLDQCPRLAQRVRFTLDTTKKSICPPPRFEKPQADDSPGLIHELAKARPSLYLNQLAVQRDELLARRDVLRKRIIEARAARDREHTRADIRQQALSARRNELTKRSELLKTMQVQLNEKRRYIDLLRAALQHTFGINDYSVPQFCLNEPTIPDSPLIHPNRTVEESAGPQTEKPTFDTSAILKHVSYLSCITEAVAMERSRLASELIALFGLKPRTATSTSIFDISLPNDLRHLQMQPNDAMGSLRTSIAMGHIAQLISHLSMLYPSLTLPHAVIFDQSRSFIIRNGPSALAAALSMAASLPQPGHASPSVTIHVDELALGYDAHSEGKHTLASSSSPHTSTDVNNQLEECCFGSRTLRLITKFRNQGLEPPLRLRCPHPYCGYGAQCASTTAASNICQPSTLQVNSSEVELPEESYTVVPDVEAAQEMLFRIQHDDTQLFVATSTPIAPFSNADVDTSVNQPQEHSQADSVSQISEISSSGATWSLAGRGDNLASALTASTETQTRLPQETPRKSEQILFGTPVHEDHWIPTITQFDRFPHLQSSSRVPSSQFLFTTEGADSQPHNPTGSHVKSLVTSSAQRRSALGMRSQNALNVRVKTVEEAHTVALACTDGSHWLDGEGDVFIDMLSTLVPTSLNDRRGVTTKSNPPALYSSHLTAPNSLARMLRWASASSPLGLHVINYNHAFILNRLGQKANDPQNDRDYLRRRQTLVAWRSKLVGDHVTTTVSRDPSRPPSQSNSPLLSGLSRPTPAHALLASPVVSSTPSPTAFALGSATLPSPAILDHRDSSRPTISVEDRSAITNSLESLGYGIPYNQYCISASEYTNECLRETRPPVRSMPYSLLPGIAPQMSLNPKPRSISTSISSPIDFPQGAPYQFLALPAGLSADGSIPALQRWSLGWIDFRSCPGFKEALAFEYQNILALPEHERARLPPISTPGSSEPRMTTPIGAATSERLQQTASLLAENLIVLKRAVGIDPLWRNPLLLENLLDLAAAVRSGPSAILNTNELQQRLYQQQSELRRAARSTLHSQTKPTPTVTETLVQPTPEISIAPQKPQANVNLSGQTVLPTPVGVAAAPITQLQLAARLMHETQKPTPAAESDAPSQSTQQPDLRALGASWEVLNMSLDPMSGLFDAISLRSGLSDHNIASPMHLSTSLDHGDKYFQRSPNDTLPNADSMLFDEAKGSSEFITSDGQITLADVDALAGLEGSTDSPNNLRLLDPQGSGGGKAHNQPVHKQTDGTSILRRMRLRRNRSVDECGGDHSQQHRQDEEFEDDVLTLHSRYSDLLRSQTGGQLETADSTGSAKPTSKPTVTASSTSSNLPDDLRDTRELAPLALELAISGVSRLTADSGVESGLSAMSPSAAALVLASSAASLVLQNAQSQLPGKLPDDFFDVEEWEDHEE